MDSRLRQLLKRTRDLLSKIGTRRKRPGRMAILSLGCFIAAYLSDWSYVFGAMCSWEQPWSWLSWHSTLGHVHAEEEMLGDTLQKTTGYLRIAALFIPTQLTEIPGARSPVSEKNPCH